MSQFADQMPDSATISISELAARWKLSRDRISTMIRQGLIPGAFRIPSAGRYGSAVRIPLSHVLSLEDSWQVSPISQTSVQKSRHRSVSPSSSHFPELLDSLESDVGFLEGDQC